MGKQNTITKDYMSVPEHFADCFNYYLFNGEQIIKPANLKFFRDLRRKIS